VKLRRVVLFALLISLVLGLAIGTALRLRLERGVTYIGSANAPHPLDVSDPRPSILDPSHHEEQVGQAV